MVGLEMSKAHLNALAFIPQFEEALCPHQSSRHSRASDGEVLRSGRHEWQCNDGQADTEQQTHTGSLGDCMTASTLMRFSIHQEATVEGGFKSSSLAPGGPAV
jgi:hypothetical protein